MGHLHCHSWRDPRCGYPLSLHSSGALGGRGVRERGQHMARHGGQLAARPGVPGEPAGTWRTMREPSSCTALRRRCHNPRTGAGLSPAWGRAVLGHGCVPRPGWSLCHPSSPSPPCPQGVPASPCPAPFVPCPLGHTRGCGEPVTLCPGRAGGVTVAFAAAVVAKGSPACPAAGAVLGMMRERCGDGAGGKGDSAAFPALKFNASCSILLRRR